MKYIVLIGCDRLNGCQAFKNNRGKVIYYTDINKALKMSNYIDNIYCPLYSKVVTEDTFKIMKNL